MRATVLAILLSTFFCTPTGVQTPKRMVENVLALAEAAAVLNVCFESPAYKKLENEKALKLHELTLRLTTLVERITKKYDDEALFLTFEMMRVKISSDTDMKEYVRNEYQYCGEKLFIEMGNFVAENERLIYEFFAK